MSNLMTQTNNNGTNISHSRDADGKSGHGKAVERLGLENKETLKITLEGFRSLSVMAIFLAGLQGTMIGISFPDGTSALTQIVNIFWLSGLVLDVVGAVLTALTARWFEVLHLNSTIHPSEVQISVTKESRKTSIKTWIIAHALFSGMGVVGSGVLCFLIGLLVLVWDKQPIAVAVCVTVCSGIMVPLVASLFLSTPNTAHDVLVKLDRMRGVW